MQPNAPCTDKAQHSRLADVNVPAEHCDTGKCGHNLWNDAVGHDLPARRTGGGDRLDLSFVDLFDGLIKQFGAKSDGPDGNGDDACKDTGADYRDK